jgi:competence ComEA-like helix-hairpin-helix protein
MAVRDERRAVLLLAVFAALGGAYRVVRTPGGPPGAPAVAPELRGEDVARQAAQSRRAEALARPLQPGERVDVDRAGAEELERLPRIGRELARRIVEERDARGPFGALGGLRRVTGIGPAMITALERTTAFSGSPRPAVPGAGAGVPTVPVPGADAGAGGKEQGSARGPCPGSGEPLALNGATAEALACVRGIGPSLAARIVADRAARGPFRRLEDLDRVPGIGARLVERFRPFLRVP